MTEKLEAFEFGVLTLTRYRCEICGREYDTFDKAKVCFDRGFSPRLELGDIVLCGRARFGWLDGDETWIAEKFPDDLTPSRSLMSFYYVVTFIDADRDDSHRPRYHLFTKAMTGEKGHNCGYTYDQHHTDARKVDQPPQEIVEDSKDLLGQTAWNLI